MKTSNRVQRNGATKAVVPQSKNRNEFALPKGDVHPSRLCIFDRITQRPVVEIPLSEQDFIRALVEPHKIGSEFQGMEIKDLIAQAIREKLSISATQVHNASSELEMAKNQSIALTWLMQDSETHHMMEGDFRHDERNRVNAGVSELVRQSSARLEGAFNSLFSALNPKREEVAS
jgi:hypothetical protein